MNYRKALDALKKVALVVPFAEGDGVDSDAKGHKARLGDGSFFYIHEDGKYAHVKVDHNEETNEDTLVQAETTDAQGQKLQPVVDALSEDGAES